MLTDTERSTRTLRPDWNPPLRPEDKLIGVTEDGSHLYMTPSLNTLLVTKARMKVIEDSRIRPASNHYSKWENCLWDYNLWKSFYERKEEAEIHKYLESLKPEDLAQLKEQLDA